MRIRIDTDTCQGHSRCALSYPEIFDVDDEAKAFVHVDSIPPEWEGRVLMAISNCPEQAIQLDD